MITDEDGKIDYSGYSVRELQEARSSINSGKYPKNFANLVAELVRRGAPVEESEHTKETALDHATDMYAAEAKSPYKARVTGFLTIVFGIAWFLLRFDDGVYSRRGREYTFHDDPLLLTFLFAMHGSIVVIGLLGLIFGSKFYRVLIKSRFSPSSFKRKH